MERDLFAFARQARQSRIQQAAIVFKTSSDDENEELSKNVISYQKVLEEQGEEGIKTLTNFNVEQFKFLWKIAKQCFAPRRGRKPTTSNKDRFFILLIYMNLYGKYKEMSILMGLSSTMLHNIVFETLQKIFQTFITKFLNFTTNSSKKFDNYPREIGAVDVSLIPIHRFNDFKTSKLFYSKKHEMHGIKLQTLVNPDGQCISANVAFRGKVHDLTVLRQSGLINQLSYSMNRGDGALVLCQHQIMCDKGYIGIHRELPNALVQARKPKGRNLTQEQIDENNAIQHDRVIVENYFGRMKSLWGIFCTPYRGSESDLKMFTLLGVCLTNFHIQSNPLRDSDDLSVDIEEDLDDISETSSD